MDLRTIIVGCDGSDGSRDALVLAGALARVAHAHLLLVTVHSDGLLPIAAGDDLDLHRAAQELVARESEAYAPEARTLVVAGASPAAALHHIAETEHASLLVLGSRAGAADGQVLAGRRVRHLLHGAPCSIAIAPAGLRNRGAVWERIGVGFDHSPEAREALAFASALARATGGTLRLRAVVDGHRAGPLEPFGALPPEYDWSGLTEHERGSAQALIDRAVADAGVQATGEVVVDETAHALVDLSEDCDVLVIGSRGWGPLARLLVGSTGDAIVHRARCPVFLVPRGASGRAHGGERTSVVARR